MAIYQFVGYPQVFAVGADVKRISFILRPGGGAGALGGGGGGACVSGIIAHDPAYPNYTIQVGGGGAGNSGGDHGGSTTLSRDDGTIASACGGHGPTGDYGKYGGIGAQANECMVRPECTDVIIHKGGDGGDQYSGAALMDYRGGGGGGPANVGGDGQNASGNTAGNGGGKGGLPGMFFPEAPQPGAWGGGGGGGHWDTQHAGAAGGNGFAQILFLYD